MSKIERFYVSGCGNHDCDPLLIDRDGDYVYYDEYEKLKAENERIERNRDMWKGQVERQAEELTTLRKDAERYRRMRAMTLAQTDDAPDEFDSAFDSQLDAALGQGEKS